MGSKFSIVIPTLNRREMLLSAIESVYSQSWPDVEVIVIDGGSTDGTLDAIKNYRNMLVRSGPDRGVYDALNKGVAIATGDIVGFLNSDDYYEPGSFAAVTRAFAVNPSADSVCGTALLVGRDRVVAVFDREEDKRLTNPRTIFIGSCIPNARFFRRSRLHVIGDFSLDYRFIADRDWLARFYDAGMTSVAIKDRVYRYRQHPGSLTFSDQQNNFLGIRQELYRLARYWRAQPAARVPINQAARLLEGRCLATLLSVALRGRNLGGVVRLLFRDGDKYTLRPVATIIVSGIDVIIQRVWLSRRKVIMD